MTKKKNQPKIKIKEKAETNPKAKKSESELDLSGLKRFEKLKDQEFKLTKIASKRPNYMVGVGTSEIGDFSFHIYEATEDRPEQIGVFITGRGFSYLRTSPIVAITDQDESSTTFETEGGIYKLEKYVPPKRN